MKKKSILIFTVLFAFLCSACAIPTEEKSVVHSMGLWPYYTFEEACEEADYIFVGTVKSVGKPYLVPMIANANPKRPSNYIALTDLTITVERMLKGVEQKEINYIQEGGETRKTIYVCDDVYELKKDERALLFITEDGYVITADCVMPVDAKGKISISSTFFPGKSKNDRSVMTKMDVDEYADIISTYLSSQTAG